MAKTVIQSIRHFRQPSFVRGMAYALDLGSTLKAYNEPFDKDVADYEALCNDWQQVGEDLSKAMERYDYVKRACKVE